MDEGREVVMFDDELILEGSKKWMFTLCGHWLDAKCLTMSSGTI